MTFDTNFTLRLNTGYKTAFQEGLSVSPAAGDYKKIALIVNSTSDTEDYAWLSDDHSLKEWIGERAVSELSGHSFAIKNKKYEKTISVKKDDIDDDKYGLYATRARILGRQAAQHPNAVLFSLLKEGWTAKAYDGKPFFSTERGTDNSNTAGGSDTPWVLMDTSQALKPLIWQVRKDYRFDSLDTMDSDTVYRRDELLFGVTARVAAGFGLWQLAYGSKAALSAATYKTARQALQNLKGKDNISLGIMPNLLVVPPALEEDARKILYADTVSSNASNIWKDSASLLVTPWMS